MSTPVMPVNLIVFRMLRGYEKTGETLYSVSELFHFAHDVLVRASVMDGEEYWILDPMKYGTDFIDDVSKICDTTQNYYEINEHKLRKGGKRWAEKKIGAMPYSFLKCGLQVLDEDLKEKGYIKGIQCD